jgi:hypothetical protein
MLAIVRSPHPSRSWATQHAAAGPCGRLCGWSVSDVCVPSCRVAPLSADASACRSRLTEQRHFGRVSHSVPPVSLPFFSCGPAVLGGVLPRGVQCPPRQCPILILRTRRNDSIECPSNADWPCSSELSPPDRKPERPFPAGPHDRARGPDLPNFIADLALFCRLLVVYPRPTTSSLTLMAVLAPAITIKLLRVTSAVPIDVYDYKDRQVSRHYDGTQHRVLPARSRQRGNRS